MTSTNAAGTSDASSASGSITPYALYEIEYLVVAGGGGGGGQTTGGWPAGGGGAGGVLYSAQMDPRPGGSWWLWLTYVPPARTDVLVNKIF